MYTALKLTKKSLPLIAAKLAKRSTPERLKEILEQNPTVPCYLVLKDGLLEHHHLWLEEDFFLARYKFVGEALETEFVEVVKI